MVCSRAQNGTSPESSLLQSPQVPSQTCYSNALSPPVHTEPLPTSSHREDRAPRSGSPKALNSGAPSKGLLGLHGLGQSLLLAMPICAMW